MRLKEVMPEEMITLAMGDIRFLHDFIVEETRHIVSTEPGLIYEGDIDLALYSAWEESQDPVKYSALVFYNLIVNHPFINGNKRTATLIVDIILRYNGYKLTASDDELFELALKVSNNEVSKDYVVEWFKGITRKNEVNEGKNTVKPFPRDPVKRRKILLELAKQSFRERRKLYEKLAKY